MTFKMPGIVQITASVAFALVTAAVAGFLWFAASVASQEAQMPHVKTDAVVVLTGGPGRVEEGFRLMSEGMGDALLVTGVHPGVTLKELVDRWNADQPRKNAILSHCCITLDYAAADTESNAVETVAWLQNHPDVETLRIVTSDYHMPRARMLYAKMLPGITIYTQPVFSARPASRAFWRNVASEFTKTFLTWLSR